MIRTPRFDDLSETGHSWCTAALDPFHDYTLQIQGLPDGHCTPSYTRVHTQTLSFGAAAANDTILIRFDGTHATAGRNYYKSYNDVRNTAAVDLSVNAGNTSGPVTVFRSPSASGYCTLQAVQSGLASILGAMALTPDMSTPSRVIALGLEVHNTTAPLYKQGMIGVVHVPGFTQTDCGRQVYIVNTTYDMSHMTLTPSMPNLKECASLIPGYAEWEAAKGIYVTARMTAPPTPHFFETVPGINLGNMPAMQNAGVISEVAGPPPSNQESWAIPFGLISGDPTKITAYTWPSFNSGFQPVQIWLSGLSAESTFRLVVRSVVEYFPEVVDTTTISNAVSVPTFDPGAFLEYHRARSLLPAGVPVDMNAKGDWWRMVKKALSTGAKLMPLALGAAGYPGLAAGAALLTSASGAVLKSRPNSQRPKKKGKQKNN